MKILETITVNMAKTSMDEFFDATASYVKKALDAGHKPDNLIYIPCEHKPDETEVWQIENEADYCYLGREIKRRGITKFFGIANAVDKDLSTEQDEDFIILFSGREDHVCELGLGGTERILERFNVSDPDDIAAITKMAESSREYLDKCIYTYMESTLN